MPKKDLWTKILAAVGTVLVWLPLLAPVFFSTAVGLVERVFRFDYLMPAELYMLALAGGVLLVWAALRAGTRRGIIAASIVLAPAFLLGGQLLAEATGLASGATEPTGWPWMLVIASLVAYTLAVLTTGIGGILLLVDLFRTAQPPQQRLQPG